MDWFDEPYQNAGGKRDIYLELIILAGIWNSFISHQFIQNFVKS
jgi:hypothetical protein